MIHDGISSKCNNPGLAMKVENDSWYLSNMLSNLPLKGQDKVELEQFFLQ